MNFYVIQVKAKTENNYLNLAKKTINQANIHFYWFRRELAQRKNGKIRNVLSPIFPGYIFLETEIITKDLYCGLRKLPGFIRFLKNNEEILPLTPKDLALIKHFLLTGEIIHKSLVTFKPQDRIQILAGPLKGLEGFIVKVDKRKQRVKVRLELYDDSFLIDFGFEAIERVRGT